MSSFSASPRCAGAGSSSCGFPQRGPSYISQLIVQQTTLGSPRVSITCQVSPKPPSHSPAFRREVAGSGRTARYKAGIKLASVKFVGRLLERQDLARLGDRDRGWVKHNSHVECRPGLSGCIISSRIGVPLQGRCGASLRVTASNSPLASFLTPSRPPYAQRHHHPFIRTYPSLGTYSLLRLVFSVFARAMCPLPRILHPELLMQGKRTNAVRKLKIGPERPRCLIADSKAHSTPSTVLLSLRKSIGPRCAPRGYTCACHTR